MAVRIGAVSGGVVDRISDGLRRAMEISKMLPAHLLDGPVDPGSFDGDDPASLVIELRIRSAQMEKLLEFKSGLLINDLPDAEMAFELEYSRQYLRFSGMRGATHSAAMRNAKLATAALKMKLLQLRGLRDWLDEKQEAMHSQVVSLRKRLEFIESLPKGSYR